MQASSRDPPACTVNVGYTACERIIITASALSSGGHSVRIRIARQPARRSSEQTSVAVASQNHRRSVFAQLSVRPPSLTHSTSSDLGVRSDLPDLQISLARIGQDLDAKVALEAQAQDRQRRGPEVERDGILAHHASLAHEDHLRR